MNDTRHATRIAFLRGLAVVLIAVHAINVNGAAASADARSAADRLAAALPERMQAAILVPHLDRMSDQLMQCLEGMDRADLLMGSRPIDQIKSTIQLSVAVDDLGGAGVVLVPAPNDGASENAISQRVGIVPVGLVAVTSFKKFISGNFTGNSMSDSDSERDTDPVHICEHPVLGRVFVRHLSNHAILSQSREAVEQYMPVGQEHEDDTAQRHLRERLGMAGWKTLERGHVAFYATQDAVKTWTNRSSDEIKAAGESQLNDRALRDAFRRFRALQFAPIVKDVLHAGRGGVVTLQFDPLALIMRKHWNLDPKAALTQEISSDSEHTASVSPLPAQSYLVAASCSRNMLALTTHVFNNLDAQFFSTAREHLADARAVHVLLLRNPAGPVSGMFNNAGLIIETPQPETMRDAIRRDLLALKELDDGVERRVIWRASRSVQGAGTSDSYEYDVLSTDSKSSAESVIRNYVLGPSGTGGYVKTVDNAVLITTTMRAGSLRELLGAWNDNAKTLGDDPVVNTMRNWLPANRDFEVYIAPDELLTMIHESPAGYVLPEHVKSRVGSNLTPIGAAAQLTRESVRSTAIVPSDTLALLMDVVRRSVGPSIAPRDADRTTPGVDNN